jgi:hypothetical protein
MRRNPVLRAVADELDRLGIPFTTELRGSGHLAVRFLGRCQIVPATTSDRRASANARAFARRVIRQSRISKQSASGGIPAIGD